MRVVSDTGPIIGLAKIGRLDLLRSLAGVVLIPPFVHKELFGKTGGEEAQIEEALKDFVKVASVDTIDSSAAAVLGELDEGERQAVALALLVGKDALLLIDNYAGRQAAKRLQVTFTGLVGLLLLAKERGLVAKVGPVIEELREAGYWLSDEIITIAKEMAGE
jgi:uncharacterized protein